MFLADAVPVFFIFVVIAVIVAVVIASVNHSKKVKETWRSVGAKYRMKVERGQGMGSRPELSGNVNGIYVHVNTVTRGSGKNRSTYTVYSAFSGASMPQGLSLTREGFFSKVGKMFGGQDIQVGDRRLDDGLIIKAQDAQGTIALLRIPQVRDALLYFVARHPGMVVNGQNLSFEEHGVASKMDRMSAAIDDLVYLTKTFEAALSGPAPQRVPTAKPAPVLQKKNDPWAEPIKAGGAAAAAEILSVSTSVDNSPLPTNSSIDPNGQEAKAELNSAFSSFKSTVENPTVHKKAEPAKQESISLDDAFAAPKNEDAFANPTLDKDVFAPTPSTFETPKWEGSNSMTDQPASEDQSTEAMTSDEGKDCQGSNDIYDVIEELNNVGFGGNRQEIIDRHDCVTFNLMVYVDRVDSTFGFDTPDHLKDGKTLEGHLSSGEKVAVRFPESMNDKIAKLHSGGEFGVTGKITAWDDLFKKVAIDYAE
ncbi:MAG: hypothetical protein ACYTDT_03780 [Planctomycetota bacterium]|jgi:hypothetical protein